MCVNIHLHVHILFHTMKKPLHLRPQIYMRINSETCQKHMYISIYMYGGTCPVSQHFFQNITYKMSLPRLAHLQPQYAPLPQQQTFQELHH